MNLHSLLDNLTNKGVKLSADGDSLLIDAPKGVMTQELRHSLAEHKAELLLLLRQDSIINATQTSLPVVVPAPDQRYEPFPLTDMQHAFWVGRSGVLDLGNVSNHGYYEIEGKDLNLERLNWALQQLIERHEMLRAVVLPSGLQQILQQVPPYQMQILDLRGQDSETVNKELQVIRDRLSHQVLPAHEWPLFDFRATLLDQGGVRLHISYDLQVFDAWSLFRLFDEWVQIYQNPDTVLSPLELSFRDYVLAEQSVQDTPLYQKSQEYWLNRLDNFPPAPDLPLAKNPKELKQHRCKRYDDGLDQTYWQQLKQRAADAGLTPSGLLLAAFAEILTVWSKSPKFTINLALFNRLPLHHQVNDLLGDFTSVTLLTVDNSTPEPFTNRARRIQQQLWQDLEHRYFSGVRVVRELARNKGAAPNAMPIVFTSTLGFSSLGQETLTFSHFGELVYGISQASQAWMDIQVWEEKGKLTFNWDVVEELFPEGFVQDMFEGYCRFLKRLATSESAWVETTRQLISPAQLARRDAVNTTHTSVPETALLHTLFFEQVPRRPQQAAVITAHRTLTYQELGDRATELGHQLRQLSVYPNQLVAIVMDKGWEQVVAALGILAAGAAYVPIDPGLPTERIWYFLKQSEVKLVLTHTRLDTTLDWPENIQRLCIDSDFKQSPETSLRNQPLEAVQKPEDLAYVIYTSGSTGIPKGVMISHQGVVNTILDINQRFHVNADDRVLALSSLSFDLSVYDIFGTLAVGGTIVIPEAASTKDAAHWTELIKKHQITVWNSVPALMQMLVEYTSAHPEVAFNTLRLVLLSGDWIPLSLPNQVRALSKGVKVISLGGATEASIWSILYPVEEVNSAWKSIPYGRPMANQRFSVLNEALEPCPVWVPGQLYIGGIGLAKGYWRWEEKTKASFIIHPQTKERLYKTGDCGQYLPDGNIEFLGREDFQVKINGYRVELGEIEAALKQHPAVRCAAIAAVGQHNTKERLVAYLVPHQQPAPTIEELRDFLSEKLPEYMLPSGFIFLDALPLSANGKVDRRALPTHDSLLQEFEVAYVAPQSEIEQSIAEIWQEVLGLNKVGINDNFFDIGGNSLLITKIYCKLKEALPQNSDSLSVVDLFKYPTIRLLGKHLTQNKDSHFLQQQQSTELAHKLEEGKKRLKQRFDKSLRASR